MRIALVGRIAGVGTGAAIGAGAGAATGTAISGATKGKQVSVPAESLLQCLASSNQSHSLLTIETMVATLPPNRRSLASASHSVSRFYDSFRATIINQSPSPQDSPSG